MKIDFGDFFNAGSSEDDDDVNFNTLATPSLADVIEEQSGCQSEDGKAGFKLYTRYEWGSPHERTMVT